MERQAAESTTHIWIKLNILEILSANLFQLLICSCLHDRLRPQTDRRAVSTLLEIPCSESSSNQAESFQGYIYLSRPSPSTELLKKNPTKSKQSSALCSSKQEGIWLRAPRSLPITLW